jgi:DNA ligase-1
MSSNFKPMLAEHADMNKITFPMYASTKLDGIRAVVINGKLLSRSLKPIPNKYVRSLFEKPEYEGLDGELIVGSPTDPKCFNKTTSGVMSEEGEPDVTYYVFDQIPSYSGQPPLTRFQERYKDLASCLSLFKNVFLVKQTLIFDLPHLLEFEAQCLEEGYEGVIIKDPNSPYKYGRSTLREGYMLKIKRYQDSEAEILSVEELLSNQNEATRDELGKVKRSNCKEGMVPQDTLGSLNVRDLKTGVEFNIGSGFDEEERNKLWKNKSSLPGKIVKYKYFGYGQVDKPRHPVFLGFRDKKDL